MNRSNYKKELSTRNWLIIRDIGPWDKYSTITNDAENVVEDILKGDFPEGMRLGYYDSNGDLGELKIENGVFVGFAPLNEQEIS